MERKAGRKERKKEGRKVTSWKRVGSQPAKNEDWERRMNGRKNERTERKSGGRNEIRKKGRDERRNIVIFMFYFR